MKRTLSLLILLISESCFASEYSDCILENMKGVTIPQVIFQIKQACAEKSLPYVPAKCSPSFILKTLDADKIDREFYNRDKNFDNHTKDTGLHSAFDVFLEPQKSSEALSQKLSNKCINECLSASYWDKHFGDCK